MIAVCYPKDGWILQRMAEHLLARIPESIGLDYEDPETWTPGGVLDSGPQKLNYFINYATMRRTTAKLDAAWFTHPEDNGLFWEVARHVDLAVCNCDQYRRALESRGCRAATVLPGVEAAFTPKLVLGFVGRFNSYGKRKGVDLLQQVGGLEFVELAVSDGRLTLEELPAFYRRLDYVLVTSRYEGGPMCLLEGLACGKQVICPPDVGFADRFPEGIVPYDNGDFSSLERVLRELYAKKLRLAAMVRDCTWERWVLDHLRLFTALIRERNA
jgi:glycosyltransferase involved in cell wall biosynthesis